MMKEITVEEYYKIRNIMKNKQNILLIKENNNGLFYNCKNYFFRMKKNDEGIFIDGLITIGEPEDFNSCFIELKKDDELYIYVIGEEQQSEMRKAGMVNHKIVSGHMILSMIHVDPSSKNL